MNHHQTWVLRFSITNLFAIFGYKPRSFQVFLSSQFYKVIHKLRISITLYWRTIYFVSLFEGDFVNWPLLLRMLTSGKLCDRLGVCGFFGGGGLRVCPIVFHFWQEDGH